MPKNQVLYPKNWDEIAFYVKKKAGFRCTRCGHPHSRFQNYVLTVHHKDGNPMNCEESNLEALCQRCHLYRQHYLKIKDTNQGELCFDKKSEGL